MKIRNPDKGKDPKLVLMRSADTAATRKYGPGGRLKKRAPKPVTLPKLKCLEQENDSGEETEARSEAHRPTQKLTI